MRKRQKRVLGIAIVLAMLLQPVASFAMEGVNTLDAHYNTGLQCPAVYELGTEQGYDYDEALNQSWDVYTNSKSTAADAAYWNQFTSNYYRSQMIGTEQTVYDEMYRVCMTYLTTQVDIQQITLSSGEVVGASDLIPVNGLSQEEIYNVWIIFCNSNPQFFFLSNSMSMGSGYMYVTIYQDFAAGSARSAAAEKVRYLVDANLAIINAEGSDFAKEKKAHDLVISKISYGEGKYNQSSAGFFLDNQTVCAGYAEAYEMLCNGAGIPTITVTSDTHEWNKTYLDGAWYLVDTTWDDGLGDTLIYYNYFNISDASATSGPDAGAHTEESLWSGFNVPPANNTYSIRPDRIQQFTTPALPVEAPVDPNPGTVPPTTPVDPTPVQPTVTTQVMYRLYNPNSGEHFYTADANEKDHLAWIGWKYEGIGWNAPVNGKPVYRMYNPNAGDHHYTTDSSERDSLIWVGWNYEGIGWYSYETPQVPLYRLYNPNATGAGSHHYTTDASERDNLARIGWRNEGIGWYGCL